MHYRHAASGGNTFRSGGFPVRGHACTAPHLKNTPLQIYTSIVFAAAQFGGEPYLPLSALELEAGCIAQWLARAPQEDELIVKGLDKFESRPRNSAWYRLAGGPMRVDRVTPQLQQEEPLGCGQGSFPPPPDVLYRESRQWMEVGKSVGDSATVSDYCCEGWPCTVGDSQVVGGRDKS